MKNLIAEKRKSSRLTISLPVSYEFLGDKKNFGSSLTKDLDENGLKIKSDNFFPANTKLIITLYFPEVKRIIRTEARTAWSQRLNYSNKYVAGLIFLNINPIYKRWLQEYILINKTFKK